MVGAGGEGNFLGDGNILYLDSAQLLKPAHLEPVLHKRSHGNEKPAHRNEE